jgi:hypothetical protein
VTTTSALLLLADTERPRSKQRAIGMSELGSCRRRTGYKLANVKPVNIVGSVQAVFGSAIHDAVANAVRQLGRPGDLVEEEVEFAGIKGHLDRYEADTQTVVDVKTTSTRWMEHIRIHGPSRGQRWQVSMYAAGLLVKGVPVKTCRIDFLVRDSGNEYTVEWTFDQKDVQDAIEWLREVRSTPLVLLPRDEEPDSVVCRGCPFGGIDGGICWQGYVPNRDFRSVMLAEGADAAETAEELFKARKQIKELERRAERLKGILDGERPAASWEVVQAGDYFLKWTRTRGGTFSLRFISAPTDAQEDE